jgi:hypothetical protein
VARVGLKDKVAKVFLGTATFIEGLLEQYAALEKVDVRHHVLFLSPHVSR